MFFFQMGLKKKNRVSEYSRCPRTAVSVPANLNVEYGLDELMPLTPNGDERDQRVQRDLSSSQTPSWGIRAQSSVDANLEDFRCPRTAVSVPANLYVEDGFDELMPLTPNSDELDQREQRDLSSSQTPRWGIHAHSSVDENFEDFRDQRTSTPTDPSNEALLRFHYSRMGWEWDGGERHRSYTGGRR